MYRKLATHACTISQEQSQPDLCDDLWVGEIGCEFTKKNKERNRPVHFFFSGMPFWNCSGAKHASKESVQNPKLRTTRSSEVKVPSYLTPTVIITRKKGSRKKEEEEGERKWTWRERMKLFDHVRFEFTLDKQELYDCQTQTKFQK